jgi:CxxC-x17-CxxC domain-containing protein
MDTFTSETPVTDHATDIECSACGTFFLYPDAERAFRREHDMPRPELCPPCRAERRASRHADDLSDAEVQNGRGPSRVKKLAVNGGPGGRMYNATCDQCGGPARVPFVPRGDRPVYCRDCFNARKGR